MDLSEKKQEFFEKLSKFDGVILVEGKKDVAALKRLGLNNVTALNRKPLTFFVEDLEARNVALLMDTDKEGKKLTKKLTTLLQDKGFKVNKKFWYSLIKLKISHVEGLA